MKIMKCVCAERISADLQFKWKVMLGVEMKVTCKVDASPPPMFCDKMMPCFRFFFFFFKQLKYALITWLSCSLGPILGFSLIEHL